MKLNPSNLFSSILLSFAAIAHATEPTLNNFLTLSEFFKPIKQDKKQLGTASSLSYTFTGQNAGSINTLRLCKATDNTCSSCNTAFTVITAGTPLTYPQSPATQTYRIPPASVAAYLASQSFSSGTYNIGWYVQSSTADCSSNYCSSNQDSTGHVLCMQATYNSGTVTSLTQSDNGTVEVNTPADSPGIYVATNNQLITYSPDNGTTWGYMLSPQGGWWRDQRPGFVTAATTDGTLYQATGLSGNGTAGNGTVALIYSSDGINWNQVPTYPSNVDSDYVRSMFSIGSTLYVGTGIGYVYSTSNQGASWQSSTTVQGTETVNNLVVDGRGNFYVIANSQIYYSTDSGSTWNTLTNNPSGTLVNGLAIDQNSGTLYAYTNTALLQYNTAPMSGSSSWVTIPVPNPATYGPVSAIAAYGPTVYVATDTSYIHYTSDLGTTWVTKQLPTDTSGIKALFVNQTAALSPLFVESYGHVRITSSEGTSTVTVKNLTNSTATGVVAKSSQLPANVTQTPAPSCASVAPGGSCSITFTASGTSAFAPTTFDIIDSNQDTIARSALVSSITPNTTNYYYVYNMNASTAYVVDNVDAGSPFWSTDYSDISGITENNTAGVVSCNGAQDGQCNTNAIVAYYLSPSTDYAAGTCALSVNGGATAGDWYLPATCEFNGGIYLNASTNQFQSCSSVQTGIASLFNLGILGGDLASFYSGLNSVYWSSTEASVDSLYYAWLEKFFSGGGNYSYRTAKQEDYYRARCSRTIP
jgi:hypothetical protein